MNLNLKSMAAAVEKLLNKADAEFKEQLESLKATVNGTLTQLQADLATAQASIATLSTAKEELETQLQTLTGKLSSANKTEMDARTALLAHLSSLPGHEAFKADGKSANATLAELIEAQKSAVNTAMAASGVKMDVLPGNGNNPANPAAKTMTRTDFEALSFSARNEFIRNGGKLKD